ncbi:hypothetical protein EW146_g1350 [Bondarzewia mesenterica]|uniref:E3 ubiquitin-protein ligase RNF220 middle domain-containing protein n=1 Tax=Bondarzewia mesenterica TaxID=1095465 RepID=A0A4S4M5M4_9AGAM|nr:hypothetical protein EW146_g1350 [Bondarzewia mesenterica]
MPSKRTVKGKKRAANPLLITEMEMENEGAVASSSSSSLSPPPPPAKKRISFTSPLPPLCSDYFMTGKRAETRPCPVCAEAIPLRLLAQHSELETERVQALIDAVGDFEEWVDPYPGAFEDSTFSRRRSVIKSRPIASSSTSTDLLKTLRLLKRRRKQRNLQIQEVTRDSDADPISSRRRAASSPGGETCPVCLQSVQGDPDVVHAHVDACIAHASMQPSPSPPHDNVDGDVVVDDVQEEGDPWEEIQTPDGLSRLRLRVGAGESARRLGFTVRDRALADVEDEVDIDGDDEGMFGTVQFTEADVIAGDDTGRGEEAIVVVQKKRDAGMVVDMEREIAHAQSARDDKALIAALEAKVKFLIQQSVLGVGMHAAASAGYDV